jgi:hypothetical protein
MLDISATLALCMVANEQHIENNLRDNLPSYIRSTVDCGLVIFQDTRNPLFYCETPLLYKRILYPCKAYELFDRYNALPSIVNAIQMVNIAYSVGWL